MTCGDCRYFDNDGEQLGLCRRRAPTPSLTTTEAARDQGSLAIWPDVYADDWCGEFVARPAPEHAPAPKPEPECGCPGAPHAATVRSAYHVTQTVMGPAPAEPADRGAPPEVMHYPREEPDDE